MSVRVFDLKVGDWVILNCPRARVMKREVCFDGIYPSLREAIGAAVIGMTTEYTAMFRGLNASERWARFTHTTGAGLMVYAVFVVEGDGAMREEEGRRVFIERRLTKQ